MRKITCIYYLGGKRRQKTVTFEKDILCKLNPEPHGFCCFTNFQAMFGVIEKQLPCGAKVVSFLVGGL